MLENLELIGTGFAVVMTVLAAISGACALIGRAFVTAEAARAAKEAAKAPAPAPAAQVTAPGIPPHHLAVIAAAVAHSLGSGYRVTRVTAPAHAVPGWPMEGRMEIFSAHHTRTSWGAQGHAPFDHLKG